MKRRKAHRTTLNYRPDSVGFGATCSGGYVELRGAYIATPLLACNCSDEISWFDV